MVEYRGLSLEDMEQLTKTFEEHMHEGRFQENTLGVLRALIAEVIVMRKQMEEFHYDAGSSKERKNKAGDTVTSKSTNTSYR